MKKGHLEKVWGRDWRSDICLPKSSQYLATPTACVLSLSALLHKYHWLHNRLHTVGVHSWVWVSFSQRGTSHVCLLEGVCSCTSCSDSPSADPVRPGPVWHFCNQTGKPLHRTHGYFQKTICFLMKIIYVNFGIVIMTFIFCFLWTIIVLPFTVHRHHPSSPFAKCTIP